MITCGRTVWKYLVKPVLCSQGRHFTVTTSRHGLYCERLEQRNVVVVRGAETLNFLQGLVTNDTQLLNSQAVVYAMMLNVQGRVLYDLLLYKLNNDAGSIAIECNSECQKELIETLSRYKLRKKIEIIDVKDDVCVWALLRDAELTNVTAPKLSTDQTNALCVADPRLDAIGYRLLLPRGVDASAVIADCKQSSAGTYTEHRCKLGVGEGTTDFPPGRCFPLESNLAFLNGVSFSKGCYVGQELTARTHHTGVIRKRIMPIVLSRITGKVGCDATVVDGTGKECGKLRTVSGHRALGLLRVAEVVNKPGLVVREAETNVADVETFIPDWWPTSADAIVQQTIAKDSSSQT